MHRHPDSAPPPSIALDASLWDEPTTGIGLYAKNLCAALERQGVRVWRIGARRSGDSPRGETSRTIYFLSKLAPVLDKVEQPIFHAVCNFNLPPTRVREKRLVLTVHDLIPELLPGTVSFAFRWQFRLWLARSLRVADKIICVSRQTRDDLTRRFQVDEEKLSVVYHGVDHVDSMATPDATGLAFLRSLALPDQYVLYGGALDARKNVEILISACARLRARGKPITLVLAGQNWFGSGALSTLVARARSEGADIRPLGYQPDSIFYELMRRASVFVFPSRYEGFGMPPLEAMRLGVPTVVSTAGALPEICGSGAIQVPPDDADGWTAKLEGLLKSPELRRTWAGAGKERSAQFTWDETARQTIQVYRSALASPLSAPR
jgi:glycosyltransferase involved in cell wall biosynthesis